MTTTKEQRNELRAELVRRLRSGKYTQGRGVLRDASDRFCCLGVACDIVVDAGSADWTKKDGCYACGGVHTCGLPPEVQDAFGFFSGTGRISWEAFPNRALFFLNDTGTPFPEIADIIESEPEGLFID